jgi:hypothetical protein
VPLPRFGKELSPEQQAVYDERDRLTKITAASAAFFREQFAGNKGMEARDYARRRGPIAQNSRKVRHRLCAGCVGRAASSSHQPLRLQD